MTNNMRSSELHVYWCVSIEASPYGLWCIGLQLKARGSCIGCRREVGLGTVSVLPLSLGRKGCTIQPHGNLRHTNSQILHLSSTVVAYPLGVFSC